MFSRFSRTMKKNNDIEKFFHVIKDLESTHIKSIVIRHDGSACIFAEKEKFEDVSILLAQTNCEVIDVNEGMQRFILSNNVKMLEKAFHVLCKAQYISENDRKVVFDVMPDYKNWSRNHTTFVKINLPKIDNKRSLNPNNMLHKNNHIGKEDNQEIDNQEIPDEFCCPITHKPMERPVTLVGSGRTYEEAAIKEWLQRNISEPISNVHLVDHDEKKLVRNLLVKQMIEKYKTENVMKKALKTLKK